MTRRCWSLCCRKEGKRQCMTQKSESKTRQRKTSSGEIRHKVLFAVRSTFFYCFLWTVSALCTANGSSHFQQSVRLMFLEERAECLELKRKKFQFYAEKCARSFVFFVTVQSAKFGFLLWCSYGAWKQRSWRISSCRLCLNTLSCTI